MNPSDVKYILRGTFNLIWTFGVCVGVVVISKITGKRIFG